MKKKKYSLNWLQWAQVPAYWITWRFFIPKKERKESFHLVLKGLETHEHRFTLARWVTGYKFLMCEHEGCNEVIEDIDIFD